MLSVSAVSISEEMGELKLLLVSHSIHGTAEWHLPPHISNIPQVIAYVQYIH